MIKSLSPYYINVSFRSPLTLEICTAYTLQIFVWDGLKNNPPSTPSYSVTKQNPSTSSGIDKINIARLVNDYIDFTAQPITGTGIYDGNNQRWCKTQLIYTTTNELDLNLIQLPITVLMTQGYGYGLDGENSQVPTNKILLSGNEFKVSRNGFFVLPVLIDEQEDVNEIVLTDVVVISESTFYYSFTSTFAFTQLYSEVRPYGGDNWSVPLLFTGIDSPQTRVVSLGGFETRIFAYNESTGNNIYSNIFTYL